MLKLPLAALQRIAAFVPHRNRLCRKMYAIHCEENIRSRLRANSYADAFLMTTKGIAVLRKQISRRRRRDCKRNSRKFRCCAASVKCHNMPVETGLCWFHQSLSKM